MRKKIAGSLTAALIMGSAGSANALLIDSFNEGAQNITVSGPLPSEASESTASDASLGGNRLIDVVLTEGGALDNTIARVIGGVFDVANNAAANADVTITWDGMTDVDLTEAGSVTGFFLSFPAAIDNALTITFEINGSTSITPFDDDAIGNDFFIDFSSFTNPTALESVDSIKMTLSDGPGWDARIDFVETRQATTTPPPPPTLTAVPEPTTLALLGLGLFGLRYRQRKS